MDDDQFLQPVRDTHAFLTAWADADHDQMYAILVDIMSHEPSMTLQFLAIGAIRFLDLFIDVTHERQVGEERELTWDERRELRLEVISTIVTREMASLEMDVIRMREHPPPET